MKKRLTLPLILALSALVVAAPLAWGLGTRDVSRVYDSLPGATWLVKAKGALTKEISYRTFAKLAAAHPGSYTDAGTGDVYTGVQLKWLVGLVDDANPATFNDGKATTGAGYRVRVTGIDGFKYDWASADVAVKDILVANSLTLSGATAATALPFGTAKYTTATDSVKFSGSWPLKQVGNDVTSGSMKVGGIVRITILPVLAP